MVKRNERPDYQRGDGSRYSSGDPLVALGFLIGAMDPRSGGDGDYGSMFPRSDAEDLSRGARFIPGEVTMERRAGRQVQFVTQCSRNCWYWQLSNGDRIYHWDPLTADDIKRRNGNRHDEAAGPCPYCKNNHTNGGTVKAYKSNVSL